MKETFTAETWYINGRLRCLTLKVDLDEPGDVTPISHVVDQIRQGSTVYALFDQKQGRPKVWPRDVALDADGSETVSLRARGLPEGVSLGELPKVQPDPVLAHLLEYAELGSLRAASLWARIYHDA